MKVDERLERPELAAWLAEHYGIDAQRAQGDVSAFLGQLRARGLLEVHEPERG